MATNGESQEQPAQFTIDVKTLIETHKHLKVALQMIQTQPGVGPLIAVQVNLMGAEAILAQALRDIQGSKPAGLVIPPPGLKI